jgi:GTPase SAR1 family protein
MPVIETVVFALNVARQVAGLILNLTATQRADDPNIRDQLNALDITLDEWIQIARALDASLPNPSRANRAQYAFEQAQRYSSLRIENPLSIPARITHSAIRLAEDGYAVLWLGQSPLTRPLRGKSAVLDIRFPHVKSSLVRPLPLPTFNITMLGKSGAGKTVYMSAMYARLVDGVRDIAIRAIDPSIDLELRDIVKSCLLDGTWPAGNIGEQKVYNFELLVHGTPVAAVNWIDYRGGDILDLESEATRAIRARIRESHAVMWMIDMTTIKGKSFTNMAARLQTDIGRYAALCHENTTPDPKAWIFVRTKSDTVRDSTGKVDLALAAKQLKMHLGDTARNVVYTGAYSRGIIIPVSSSGPVRTVENQQIPEGDDPLNVHWPFLIALASLLEGELQRLLETNAKLREDYDDIRTSASGGFFRRLLKLPPTSAELTLADQFSGPSLFKVRDCCTVDFYSEIDSFG